MDSEDHVLVANVRTINIFNVSNSFDFSFSALRIADSAHALSRSCKKCLRAAEFSSGMVIDARQKMLLMACDLILTGLVCQVSIEYQNQAGVAQRQARGKGISIELQCGGSASSVHIALGLTPREVGAQAQQKLRQVLSTHRQEQFATIANPSLLGVK